MTLSLNNQFTNHVFNVLKHWTAWLALWKQHTSFLKFNQVISKSIINAIISIEPNELLKASIAFIANVCS